LDGERYSQHMLLNSYAQALLAQARELEMAQRMHFEYYERLHGNYNVNQDEDRHDAMQQNWPNMRIALIWGLNAVPERTCDLLEALDYFMMLQQPSAVRMNLFQQGIEAAKRAAYQRGEGNCIARLGNVHRDLNEFAQARLYYKEALSIFNAID